MISQRKQVLPAANEESGSRKGPASLRAPRRIRIEKILVPVDFSASAQAAYEFALKLAGRSDARVHLLHVLQRLPAAGLDLFPQGRNRNELIARTKKELVGFAKGGGHPVVPVYPEVRVGSPWEEIVDAAEDDGVDLIVISTHGYSGVKRWLIGSVAERVVRHAPCPVLVLRSQRVELLTVRTRKRVPRKESL
jgi:universal stress protein A